MGSLLIAGTTSDAGKTTLVTGVCRWLGRRGVRVAPFKAQNMSNNSMVCADGAEIGRAQWIQAVAAGAEPEAAMNPVLLKPGSDRRSHVVLLGEPWGELSARGFLTERAELAKAAFAAYDDLASRYDVVISEGAGSPTEINLRQSDYVNMGLAQHTGAPVVVVGDIDRGGLFASMFGTVALLSPEDQRLISGFVVNKFRGDVSLLQPGIDMLTSVTDRPTYGVVPWLPELWLDSEDALDIPARRTTADSEVLTIAVVRFPRISNFTDLDALAVEPTTSVFFTASPAEVRDADLVVLPGSRATTSDLAWLRSTGLADAVATRVAADRPVLGICGGYQVLGGVIDDPYGVEGGGRHDGLGLLPVATEFAVEKTLARPAPTAYEIHHGVVRVVGDAEEFPGGCRAGATWGTIWHGLLDDDAARHAFLTEVAGLTGKRAPDGSVSFAGLREERLERLADAIDEHLDTDALLDLIERGAPSGLRFVPPGAPG
ncbi:adenosylcobyric acid synthase (glutamine-hydrolysing) [Kribbella amoyensis]|uniref:Cobyric acid synthase n=1 Tax=Kribbella amoyensis TaxID=996641 RepID=A0A561BYC9_9ACTN|nr:cobyric acid synthase [Kribbella amoyensis]TWD83905.1 adenosylcobyric acid synthase (glutamine-hydrolysing) [Kribbella amoyensis]